MELRSTFTRRQSDLLLRSLSGCRQWLQREWDNRVLSPALTVVLANTYQGEKTVATFQGATSNDPLRLPYAVMVPVQFGNSSDRFNSFALSKLGIATGRVDGARFERREKVKPVEVGLGVAFTCRDVEEALVFAQIWSDNNPDASFEVRQNATGFAFRITIVPDSTVSIPQREDNEPGETLTVRTTLLVKTFAGTTETNPLTTRVSLGFYSEPDGETVELSRITHNGYHSRDPRVLARAPGGNP